MVHQPGREGALWGAAALPNRDAIFVDDEGLFEIRLTGFSRLKAIISPLPGVASFSAPTATARRCPP